MQVRVGVGVKFVLMVAKQEAGDNELKTEEQASHLVPDQCRHLH